MQQATAQRGRILHPSWPISNSTFAKNLRETLVAVSSVTSHRCQTKTIAVGTIIADRPPHRSVRAALPHTALTLDVDMQTARWDKDEGSSVSVASVNRASRTFPRSSGVRVGCDGAACGATGPGLHHEIVASVGSCRGQHNTDTSRDTHCAATRRLAPGRRGVSVRVSP